MYVCVYIYIYVSYCINNIIYIILYIYIYNTLWCIHTPWRSRTAKFIYVLGPKDVFCFAKEFNLTRWQTPPWMKCARACVGGWVGGWVCVCVCVWVCGFVPGKNLEKNWRKRRTDVILSVERTKRLASDLSRVQNSCPTGRWTVLWTGYYGGIIAGITM